MTSRQRKSNVDVANPKNEFLKSQIDTLKTVISQNNEEIKILKESNDLKSRRINQLESQLLLAHESLAGQNSFSGSNTNESFDAKRVDTLEANWELMNNTILELNDKMKTFDKSLLNNLRFKASSQSMQTTCGNCDVASKNRQDYSSHLKATTDHNKEFLCDLCSYYGIHLKDLERHKNTMHHVPFKCRKCDSEFCSKSHLYEHLKEDHKPTRSFYRQIGHQSTI